MKKTNIVLTLGRILIITLCISVRANGRSNRIPDITNEYYRQIEKAYVDDVKDKLTRIGFSNAGVAMTKVVNDKGGFDYTLKVHHRRIDRMDESAREELSRLLTSADIDVDNSFVAVRYIEY